MSDLAIYLPRQDFERKEDYDVIDSVLISAGFTDSGVVSMNERAFRRYEISRTSFMAIPEFGVQLIEPDGEQHYLYMASNADVAVMDKLAVFGLNMMSLVNVGDFTLWQFSMSHFNLPNFAKMAKDGIHASRRLVEEMSYYRWVHRGCGHGSDWMDWFLSEWEADERLKDILKAISVGS